MSNKRRAPILAVALLVIMASSCIGPKERDLGDRDRVYVLTEHEVLSEIVDSPNNHDARQRFSTMKSRQHGYYFFYNWSVGEGNAAVKLNVRGALMNTAKAARTIHRTYRFDSQERDDLAVAYAIDSARLSSGLNNFLLSLLDGRRTYSVEVEGTTISEDALRAILQDRFGAFREENLHGYPKRFP